MQLVLFCGIQASGKSTFYPQPHPQTVVATTRRQLATNLGLPLGAAGETFIRQWLPAAD